MSQNKTLSLILMFQLLLAGFFVAPITKVKAAGTTYYVDCNAANDLGAGTSTVTAWKTINKVNNSTFQPGDSILFNKGCTWREQLTVPSSGTSGNPITFGAYGSGAKPVISGADVVSSFKTENINSLGANFTNNSTDTPVSWWMMDNTSIGESDGSSTSANLLTWNGGATASSTSKQGSYSLFTPTASDKAQVNYGSISSSLPFKATTTAFTVGGWVYVKGNFDTFAQMFSFSDGSSKGFYIQGGSTAGHFRGRVYSSGGTVTIDGDNAYATDGWHHVVLRWNGISRSGAGASNEISLWVDGIKQSTTVTRTSVALVTASPFALIGGTNAAQLYDEAFMFDLPLTDAQIANIYNYGLDGTINGSGRVMYFNTPGFTPSQIFRDGTRLTLASSKAGMLTGQWWWDSINSRIYLYDDPSGHIIEASRRNNSVDLNTKSYVTFQYLDFEKANLQNFYFNSGSFVVIDNCIISGAYHQGIYSRNGAASQNIIIQNSNIIWNGSSGITFITGSNGITIKNNSIYNNSQISDNAGGDFTYNGGVYFFTTDNSLGDLVIQNNEVYSNGVLPDSSHVIGSRGFGIWLDTVNADSGAGGIISHNKVFDNTGDGIRLEHSTYNQVYYNLVYNNNFGITVTDYTPVSESSYNQIYNNVVYGSVSGGIFVSGASNGLANRSRNNIIKNNIIIGNHPNLQAQYGGENDGTMGSGNVYLYNDFGSQSSNFIQWSYGVYKSTYSSFESAYCGSTGCSHSIQSDPLFTNAAGGDFTLQSSSPAIDSGIDLGSTYKLGLSPSSVWPSSVSLLDNSINGSGWDIGAYVYPATYSPRSTTAGTMYPVFSNIKATNITSSSVAISFNSDIKTIGTVVYTNTNTIPQNLNSYTLSSSSYTPSSSPVSATSQTITLMNLAPSTTYHFRVKDSLLPDYSGDYVFTTLGAGNIGTSTPTTTNPTVPLTPIVPVTPSSPLLTIPGTSGNTGTSGNVFTRPLSLGSKGEDVKLLQQYLNSQGFTVAKSGPGSKGHETTLFGYATRSALIKFQKAHISILKSAPGIVGPGTLGLLNGR